MVEITKKRLTYVLITPAHNEEAFIGDTIESVIAQTEVPLKWVIVNDGSTDRTGEIVDEFARQHRWIEQLRMPVHKDRQFAAKVAAFNCGYERVVSQDFDIVGNLDADITFEKDYFEFLLTKFAEDGKLGVAGTPFVERSFKYNYRFTSIDHVSGACQLFRRKCFEHIGGYVPVRSGGIDWIAVTTARMKGWKTRTFTEKVCYHHRQIGTGDTNSLVAWFKYGQKDYHLGGHPLWEIFRGLYQMKSRPYVLGGLLLLAGFVYGSIAARERVVSKELMMFHRKEQLKRLREFFAKARRIIP